jgi:hypothetical protein
MRAGERLVESPNPPRRRTIEIVASRDNTEPVKTIKIR